MAFVFTTFLFVAIAFLIVLLLFSEIFLFLFVARADNPQTTIGYSLSNLVTSVFYAFTLAFQTLSSFFVTLASNISTVFIVATSIGVLIVVAEVYTVYQSTILQSLDGNTTEFILPLYKSLILPIANMLRIMYASGICWYNSVASVTRVIYYQFFNILFECTIPEWVDITQSILDAFAHFANAMLNWIASGWQDDFEWKPVVDDFGFAIANLTAPFTCACADLFHGFNYIGRAANDNNLHWSITNILNAAFSIVRIIFTVLFKILTLQFFMPPYYGCDSSLPPNDLIACIATTPPQFFPTFNLTCLAITNFTVTVDNVIENIIIEITGDPAPNIMPDFFTPFGSLLCGVVHAAENVIDLGLHLQLAIPTAFDIQYISRLRTHNIIFYLFQAMDEFDVFFSQIDQTIVAYIGCTLTNLLRAFIQILDFVLGLLKVLANNLISGLFLSDDGASILDYLVNYPYVNIQNYLQLCVYCLDVAAEHINEPLGNAIRAIVNAISEILNMISILVANIARKRQVQQDIVHLSKRTNVVLDSLVAEQQTLLKRDIADAIVNQIAPLWAVFKNTIHSTAIALGNVVRQIEIKPGCTLRNPFDLSFPPPPSIVGAGIFCNIGAVLEDGTITISGLFELFIDTLIAALTPGSTLASIVDPDIPSSPFNIDTHFWNPFKLLILDITSFFPNILSYIDEPVITEAIVPNASTTLNDLLRLILCPIEILVIILNNIARLLAGTSIDFCVDIIKPLWNCTIGRLVSLTLDLIIFIIDIISWIPGAPTAGIESFQSFIDELNIIFGLSENCTSGCTQFIDIVCDIFAVLTDVFKLLYTLFTDPAGFFKAVGTALISVFDCIGDLLSGFFELFTEALEEVFSDLGTCIGDWFSGFFSWLGDCLERCFDSVFTCCGSYNDCDNNVCGEGPPTPGSCGGIGANWPDFSSFGDDFVACVENIEFNISSKRRRSTLIDGVLQRFNLTWSDEMMIAAKTVCAPLMPFMVNVGVNSSNIDFNATSSERAARKFIYTKEAHDCLFSAVTARMFEKYILFEQDPHANIVPKLWTYDTWSGLNFTLKSLYASYYIASYEYYKFKDFISKTEFNITLPTIDTNTTIPFATTNWLEWCMDNNIENDKFTVRLGWWITTAVDHLLYKANTTNAFGFGPMLMRVARAVFGNGGVVGALKTSSSYISMLAEQTNGTLMKRYLTEELPYKLTLNPVVWQALNGSARDSIMNSPFMRSMSNWTIARNFARIGEELAQKPERLRTLMAPMRYLRRIQQRVAWNHAGRPTDWYQGVVPPNTRYTRNTMTEYQVFAMNNRTAIPHLVRQHYARESMIIASSSSSSNALLNNTIIVDRMTMPPPPQFVQPSSSQQEDQSFANVDKRSNLAGVDLCIVNRCLNCSLLERIVDDIIDLFYLCGTEAATKKIEFNGDLVQSSTGQPQTPAYRPDFYNKVADNQLKRNTMNDNDAMPPWMIRQSLSKQFMNHDTDEERVQLELIIGFEKYFIEQQEHQLRLMFPNESRYIDNATELYAKNKRAVLIDPSITRAPVSLDKLAAQQSVAFTFTGFIYSLINDLIKSVFGIDLQGFIIDGVNGFLSDSNSSGVGVWIKFLRTCNYIDGPRCNSGRQGYGLLNGFFYTILALAITTALVVAFGQIPVLGLLGNTFQYTLLPFLWIVMFYPIWQSFAYFNSPSCAYIAPLPILHDCLANDAWVILRDGYAPCINWAQLGLPGLTTVECPPPFSRCVSLINFSQFVNATSASQCPPGTTYAAAYERVFVDCTAEPYYFVDGLRNFFFIVKTQYPSTYDMLVTSTFFPIQYLLSVSFVNNLLVFDFGPTGVASDTWTSCNKVTILNWLPLIVTLGFGLMALVIAAALLFIGLVVLFLIGLALTVLWATIISALTGYRNDVSQIDNSSAQYIRQQQQQMMRAPPINTNSRPMFPQQSIQMPSQSQYGAQLFYSGGGGINHRNVMADNRDYYDDS